jgi:AcrR family transcriptional regulator
VDDIGQPKAARPRIRDAQRSRAAILAAALSEFSQAGYGGARIDRIAKAASVHMRMIYHYFESKEGLYLAVLEAAYDKILTLEYQLAIDLERPLEGMLALLGFVYDYFEANPEFEGLLLAENAMRGRFVLQSKEVAASSSRLRALIATLIDSGERQGVFRRGLDPTQVYVSILALSRFHLSNAYSVSALLGADLTDPDWRRARLDHVREMLTAYLRA